MTNTEKLATLNAFRATEGLAAYKDWRPARHQVMLDVYMAAAELPAMSSAVEPIKEVAEAAKELDFADKRIAEAVKAEKLPSYKEFARYDKSSVDKPVAFIHQFLSQHPTLTRKQAVHALVSDHGINYSTARTQYQRWFVANKRGN